MIKNVYTLSSLAFVPKYSTNLAWIDITEIIRCTLDFDLQKAFYAVSGDILQNDLNHYGIIGIANYLILCYVL